LKIEKCKLKIANWCVVRHCRENDFPSFSRGLKNRERLGEEEGVVCRVTHFSFRISRGFSNRG
jgi:hypothetical protein